MDIFDFFYDRQAIIDFGNSIKRPQKIKNSIQKMDEQTKILKIENDIEKVAVESDFERHNMSSYEPNLHKISFKGSAIIRASIAGVEIDKLSYWGIIRFIYEFIDDVNEIKKYSRLSIIDGKYTDKGFVYVKSLNISVQGVTADRSLKEIFTQVLMNNFDFCIEIARTPRKWVFFNE